MTFVIGIFGTILLVTSMVELFVSANSLITYSSDFGFTVPNVPIATMYEWLTITIYLLFLAIADMFVIKIVSCTDFKRIRLRLTWS